MNAFDPKEMDREARVRWHVAVHEVGHAVIGTASGLEVRCVQLDSEDPRHGLTCFAELLQPEDGDFNQPPSPDAPPPTEDEAEGLLAQYGMWKAGRLAEEHLIEVGLAAFGEVTAAPDGDDQRCAWARANMPATHRDRIDEELEDVKREIADRWEELVAAARHLFNEGELCGDDLAPVCD